MIIIRGTRWTTFRGKRIHSYARLKNENIFRWDLKFRSMGYGTSSLPLSYLTYWWRRKMKHMYQVPIPLFTYWHYAQTKYCVTIAGRLILDTTDNMWQECYIRRDPQCSKKMFFPPWYFLLLHFKINEACYINKWLHSSVYVLMAFICQTLSRFAGYL